MIYADPSFLCSLYGWDGNTRTAQISEEHTEKLGAAAIDLWHVSAALLLHADTFWTFDGSQCALAQAVGKFRHVPRLPTA